MNSMRVCISWIKRGRLANKIACQCSSTLYSPRRWIFAFSIRVCASCWKHPLVVVACCSNLPVGSVALAASAMMASERSAWGAAEASHHPAPRERIIFLFMQGGVSQVDSFDYKPLLADRDGQTLTFDDVRQLAKTGKRTEHRLMRSPWKFSQYGESGRHVSELFPKMAQHVDDMCLLHAMHTEGVAHGPATLFLHCGSTNFIRPSFGSWVLCGWAARMRICPVLFRLRRRLVTAVREIRQRHFCRQNSRERRLGVRTTAR